ncbi:helix-turn-helix domain-containing protein [Oceanospirillaceae bacterium ASx5O]|nr:helix-turn-helix domain-containing protein [Oceanospirillaceae bacterium ASx5O]
MTISERIAERRAFLNLSQARLASKVGVSDTAVSKWESGFSQPKGRYLNDLASALRVSVSWLLTGDNEKHPLGLDPEGVGMKAAALSQMMTGEPRPPYGKTPEQPAIVVPAFSDEYALIPVYDVKAAAGNGAAVQTEDVVDTLVFKREWIHQTLHANPNDLYLIAVQGESMTPTLHPGDMILVDRRTESTIGADGIYVLRMGDSLLVKRVQRLPGRTLRISSDNPAYQSFELPLDSANDDDLAIIGRVVWAGRRM